MSNTPTTEPLETTSGTLTSTTDMPTPQLWDLGTKTYKADVGANAHQLSGSANPTATSITIPLGSLSPEGNILYDAKSATVIIANGATGQTITDAHLQFTDTVGGQTVTIDYPCAGIGQWKFGYMGTPTGVTLGSPMAIAASSYQTFTFPLRKGVLKNVQLVLTYGVAPTTGTATAQVVFSNQNLPTYTIPPVKLFSCDGLTALTASSNFKISIHGAFERASTMRTLELVNNGTGANSSGINVWGYDSSVITDGMSPGFGVSANASITSALNNNNYLTFSDSFYSANAANQTNNVKRFADVTDSLVMQIIWSATAATGGTLDVYASQQID